MLVTCKGLRVYKLHFFEKGYVSKETVMLFW